MSKAIEIKWAMPDPPIAAKSWSPIASETPSIADNTLEAALDCPVGSLAYLRAAMKQNLSRYQGWDVEDEAGLWAASIYKRGVDTKHSKRTELKGSYDVYFADSITSLRDRLDEQAFYIVDQAVYQAWPQFPWPQNLFAVAASESSKTLATVAQILTAAKASKCKTWCAVGGGIACDMAAFAAALAGREIQLVPTTLLAMADACVGGKTGVNFFPYGKNQLGRFYFPSSVAASPMWLQTLPERHLLSGVAECLKHAYLVGNLPLSEKIVLASQASTAWSSILPDIVQIKANVISRDAAETGERATLNFGHTLAHSLEAIAHASAHEDHAILHGEAVALGIYFAALLSHRVRGMPQADLNLIARQLTASRCAMSRSTLERRLGRADLTSTAFIDRLLEAMRHDKKASGNAIRFVTLEKIGKPFANAGQYSEPITESLVASLWSECVDSLTEV